MIRGRPLCDAIDELIDGAHFARTLANWLKELHSIPMNTIIDSSNEDIPWQFNVERCVSRCYENLEKYSHYFEQAQFSKKVLIAVIEMIRTFPIENNFQSILHGDLYCRHIIVDDNLKPAGLIDFGDIFVGDPGIDLSVGMIFSEKALSIFLNSYGDVSSSRLKLLLFHASFFLVSASMS